MKFFTVLSLGFLFLHCFALFAVPFEGARLTEANIKSLHNGKCEEFSANSMSAKSAMPGKLIDIVSQENFITVKILSCTIKQVTFEYYLILENNIWIMFDAESIVITDNKTDDQNGNQTTGQNH